MKKVITLILFLLFCFGAYSQVMFEKTYDDAGNGGEAATSVKQTNDNGYIMTGSRYQLGGQYDVLLVKTDVNGSLVWSKTFGGDSLDVGNAVIQTNDGGYFIAGFTESFPPADTNICAIRTNAAGDTLWTKTYGGAGYDEAHDAKQTASGGFIMVGTTTSFGAGSQDIYVICTNAGGDTLWTKTYGRPVPDIGSSIQLTSDGGYIICGQTVSSQVSSNAYLIKIDSIGNLMWAKSYFLNVTYFSLNGQRGNSVKQTADGGYIIIGDNLVSTTAFKTDASGNFQWGTQLVLGPEFCYGIDIVQTNDGGYVLASTEEWFPPTYYIVLAKLDGSGNLIWSESFTPQTSNETGSMVLDNDGGFAIAGWTADGNIPSDPKVCLIKTNSGGFNGCQSNFSVSTSSATATIDSGCVVSATQTVTAGTSTNVTTFPLTTMSYCFATVIEKVKSSDLILSPNPATNELRIENAELKIDKIEIYNVLGEIFLQQQTTNNKQQTVDISQLTSGIYFVKVKTDSGVSTSKFIKE